MLPELIGPGSDPPASPPRWPGHDLIGELCSSGGHLGIEGGSSFDGLTLMGGVGADLARPVAAGVVLIGLFVAGPGDGSLDTDLAAQGLPVEEQRRLGVGVQIVTLTAVVVRVEHKAVLPPRLEEDHPDGRTPSGVGGSQGHGFGGLDDSRGLFVPPSELHQRITIDGLLIERPMSGSASTSGIGLGFTCIHDDDPSDPTTEQGFEEGSGSEHELRHCRH